MQTTMSAAESSPTTYTTIPISISDVISRSLHNLSSTFSRHRPWPEFIAAGVFDRPGSLSDAISRASVSANYFRFNYALLLAACAALSLIGSPFTLVVVAFVFLLWPILYFCREDPLFVWDYHVSDRIVLVGLVLLSVLTVFLGGVAWNLVLGIGIGALICAVHGALRNPEGLRLDEAEASYSGYGSGSSHGYDVRIPK